MQRIISQGQERWRSWFESTYRFGIALYDHPPAVQLPEAITMARTITLPERQGTVTFTADELADIRLTLLNPEQPKGQGVVIADALDTDAKARVRCRNAAAKLGEPQTITGEQVPAEFWTGDTEDDDVLDFLKEYEDMESEDREDGERLFILPAIRVKSHTVQDGEQFLPVLSRKD